jgi:hydantoinase/carbamoylase family amidase
MSERVLRRLDELYAIDGGPGANRPGLSAAEQEAHDLVAGWMEEAGLAVSVDPAGNLFGRLPGAAASDEIWAGSHLDSVPQGGRFDGALGVVAALEAVERLGRQDRTLAVVAFRDEEGWRFGHGCFGSRALCGGLAAAELETADDEGISIADAVRSLGLGPVPAGGWLQRPPAAFVELHVEQGPVLEAQGAPLGIVTSIVGLARLRVAFTGQGGHAGTTPMAGRRDALVAAARFVLAVKKAAEARDRAVATIGQLTVEPNAANVIPARVELLVDARAPDDEALSALVGEIEAAAEDAEVERVVRMQPAEMHPHLRAVLRAALEELGLHVAELPSGAGHDAGILAAAGVPSAMLFVRSGAGGVSHSPDEHSDDADVALGVDALEHALWRLATPP